MEEMNYNKLREIQRMVRASTDIVELQNDFYASVQEYLKNLEKRVRELNQTMSVFAEDARTQIFSELNNARKIVIDIFDRRERKIVLKALSAARTRSEKPPKNLLDFEKERYHILLAHILEPRKALLEPVLNGKNHDEKMRKEEAPLLQTAAKKITQIQPKTGPKAQQQKGLKTLPLLISEEIPTPFVWEDENTYGPFEKNTRVVLPHDLAEFLIQSNKARIYEDSPNNETVLPVMQEPRRAQADTSESSGEESARQDRADSLGEDSERIRFNTIPATSKKQTPP